MDKEKLYDIVHSFRKHAILLLGVFTIIYAMFMPDFSTWTGDYKKILTSQAYLLHDFTEVGGLSATFINVGLHFIIAYILIIRNDFSKLRGLQIAAIGIFTGHAFFGSNILNILPIMFGVALYARWSEHSFKMYTAISMFATAMSPLVSLVIFKTEWGILSLIFGILLGIFLGFFSAPLAEEFLKFHQGFTLYNFGFTTGMFAMFVVIFLRYMKIDIEPAYYISRNYHKELLIYILLICILLLVSSVRSIGHIKKEYPKLLKASGRVPSDYISTYGLSTTLFNMAVNTLIFLGFILLTGFPLNGTLAGGLLSVMGFSAFGKNIKSSTIIGLGVVLAAFLHGGEFVNQRLLLVLLFSTGLSPIAGYYGLAAGIAAGFLHYNLVSVIIQLHLGMSLYNNGFASGFVAAFLVPFMDTILKNRNAD